MSALYRLGMIQRGLIKVIDLLNKYNPLEYAVLSLAGYALRPDLGPTGYYSPFVRGALAFRRRAISNRNE